MDWEVKFDSKIKDQEYNRLLLKYAEQAANEYLNVNEKVYLNDIYDMLGIPKTIAGSYIRWEKRDGELILFDTPEYNTLHFTIMQKGL